MKKSDRLVKKRAEKYFENQRKALTAPDAMKNFYRNVKSYNSKEKPPAFDVKDLYPAKTESKGADALATHFNAISSEFRGLSPEDVPTAESRPLRQLSAGDVEKRLKDFRKPKSMVQGDIFPALVNRVAGPLSVQLSDIYNCITTTKEWPKLWKTEYVTPIPKKSLPQSPNDLRNISCTKLLSKVYESFVLERLTDQVTLRSNQYGGMKGSGSKQFLINL